MDANLEETRNKLLGSLLEFIQFFYYARTGRKFQLSNPQGRETHFISICRELTRVFNGEIKLLNINLAPRYGKSEILIHFCAWAFAHYPSCNFIYASYAMSLAKKQTQTIRSIMKMKEYKMMFGDLICEDTSAKDNFETNAGGAVFASGVGGPILGRGAGVRGVPHFSGCILLDDLHKPVDVKSDIKRESVPEWFYNTVEGRRNGLVDNITPIIHIGQRVHEEDAKAIIMKPENGWNNLVIQSLDEHENALYPEIHSREMLLEMKRVKPYVFAAQHQQDPLPAGGVVFKPEWFVLTENDPEIISTFLTVDTAETEKNYNDATVFSFWGLYKIKHELSETGLFGLHWIDCIETWIEPKDLEDEFMQFYTGCMRYRIKPTMAVIEKKSTGVTLSSVLQKYQGLQVIPLNRTVAERSKADRFLDCQYYAANRLISLPEYGRHTHKCIDHMRKITLNDSHSRDDICDTFADAVKIALIDKVIITRTASNTDYKSISSQLYSGQHAMDRLKKKAYR